MKKLYLNFTSDGIYVFGWILLFLTSFSMAELDTDVPTGVAALPSGIFEVEWSTNKVEGCTGGGNGEVVTAKSGGELAGYLKGDTPMYIQLEGSISGSFDVGSNKTIIGMGEGASLRGMLAMGRVSNIIIRNLNISGGTDGLGVYGPHNVWIDHCDLSACADGLCDIKSGADQITLSWTKFSKHNKTMLINSGSIKPGDRGRLHVTLDHLFFDGTVQRNPRAGIGQVHILNCYYNACQSYGVHVYGDVEVTVEGCFFKNTKDAVSLHKPGSAGAEWQGGYSWNGYVQLIDNITENSTIAVKSETDSSKIFQIDKYYMYDWLKHKASEVPAIIEGGVGTGAKWSKLGPLPIPGQGVTIVDINPTLKWTKVGSKESNKVYFGKTNPPPEAKTVDGYSYQPGKLEEGTVYYWKINDGKVWKFRTKGTPVPNAPTDSPSGSPTAAAKKIQTKSSPVAQKAPVSSLRIQKDARNKSGLFIGVEKNKNGQKQLYDVLGREQVNQKTKQITSKEQ